LGIVQNAKELVSFFLRFSFPYKDNWAWGSVVVKALHYCSDGPGIDSRWCHGGFFSVVLSGKIMCSEVDSASEKE
jgi:hypothetical protein